MIKSLPVAYHDNSLIGGHFAIKRTLDKIQQQYWWPTMKKSVNDHIKSCIVCQAYSTVIVVTNIQAFFIQFHLLMILIN